jgi:hypothetical protein
MQKSPAISSRGQFVGVIPDSNPFFIVSEPDYAARVAVSATASGTGPQMYAEKTGVGSVLSPLEMMMPMGSDDPVSLRSFFI